MCVVIPDDQVDHTSARHCRLLVDRWLLVNLALKWWKTNIYSVTEVFSWSQWASGWEPQTGSERAQSNIRTHCLVWFDTRSINSNMQYLSTSFNPVQVFNLSLNEETETFSVIGSDFFILLLAARDCAFILKEPVVCRGKQIHLRLLKLRSAHLGCCSKTSSSTAVPPGSYRGLKCCDFKWTLG